MVLPYYPAIPKASDNPSVSQGQMLSNFGSINQQFGTPTGDHIPLTSGSGNGNHVRVTLNAPQADPTLIDPQSQIYPKAFGTSSLTTAVTQELYYADTRSINGYSLFRLIPTIKSMCRFTMTANGPQPIISTNSLVVNVSMVNRTGRSFDVTFTKPLDYNTYYVFITLESIAVDESSVVLGSKTTAGFTMQIDFSSFDIVGFMVI